MKIMGIDLGDARTGISISDPTGFIAGSPEVISEWNREKLIDKIVEIVNAQKIEKIVLGLPKNMNNSEGERAQKSREFKEMLEGKINTPIILWDERGTTISAHAALHSVGKKMKKHKSSVDAVAATIILQGYLDSERMNG